MYMCMSVYIYVCIFTYIIYIYMINISIHQPISFRIIGLPAMLLIVIDFNVITKANRMHNNSDNKLSTAEDIQK